MHYAIFGATGNTGLAIARKLVQAGKLVSAFGRNVDKLTEFPKAGARALAGDLANLPNDSWLRDAMQGVNVVYALIPPNYKAENFREYQNKVAKNLTDAIQENKIKHVVTLSSVGAHLTEKAGVVQGLYDFEQMLNKVSGLNVLHLRPSYFMENLYGQIATIKQMNMMGSPMKADLSFPLVLTKDIADVAVRRLLELNFKGQMVQYVLGPRNVTFNEIAKIIGKAIGKTDLKYTQFPPEDAKKAMMEGMGLSESVANAMNEFVDACNQGKIFGDIKRSPENTTPTTLEDFAKDFAKAYQGA